MVNSRWWNVAVVATAIVMCLLLVLEQVSPVRLTGGIAVNALLVVVWFAIGRRALTQRRPAIVLSVAVILLAGTGTGFDSSMATLQCICFPIIWVVLDRTRDAVIANVGVALSVGLGMFISTGAMTQSLILAITIEGLSLAFSLALGLWITSISDQSFERKRLIDELEETQAQLAALSRDAGAASERERLALEIHDTIAQDLTGLVMTAERGRRELRDGNVAAADAQLAVLEENARNALAETRALVASGAAVGVDGSGLATALARLGERFERETGIRITVVAENSPALDRDGEVVLLRCAQEALANVRKHSAAPSATLTLTVTDDNVSLHVCDDGKGFDDSVRSSGFGLEGMRGRLALVSGSLEVTTTPGGGTTLVASLPRMRSVTA
jgi:signal transduction histidine kinase